MKTKGRRKSANIDDRSSFWGATKAAAKNAFGLTSDLDEETAHRNATTIPSKTLSGAKPMVAGMDPRLKMDRELRARNPETRTPTEQSIEADRRHYPLRYQRTRWKKQSKPVKLEEGGVVRGRDGYAK